MKKFTSLSFEQFFGLVKQYSKIAQEDFFDTDMKNSIERSLNQYTFVIRDCNHNIGSW